MSERKLDGDRKTDGTVNLWKPLLRSNQVLAVHPEVGSIPAQIVSNPIDKYFVSS
jgi:hypothetical protein